MKSERAVAIAVTTFLVGLVAGVVMVSVIDSDPDVTTTAASTTTVQVIDPTTTGTVTQPPVTTESQVTTSSSQATSFDQTLPVTVDGVGELSPRVTVAAAEAIVGKPLTPSDAGAGFGCYYLEGVDGLTMIATGVEGELPAAPSPDDTIDVLIFDSGWKTLSGIGAGDTYDDLVATYGEARLSSFADEIGGGGQWVQYVQSSPDGIELWFRVWDDNEIGFFVVGAWLPIEGCQ